MARFNFCFPLGWPNYTFAELDGYAEVNDRGEIEEVFLPDYADRNIVNVSVAGRLFDDIEKWLLLERGKQIVEATDEARAGRVASDHEMFRGAQYDGPYITAVPGPIFGKD